MRVVLVADAYPPLRTSGAVQLRDLARQFVLSGHEITVVVASPELATNWTIEQLDGVQVLRLRTPKFKDVGYVRRTLGEFLMPFVMRSLLKKTPVAQERWDGVIWYSPSIFFGPLIKYLKRENNCLAYLIIRDIFPEWAADMGLMGRGPVFQFFKWVANYQYEQADTIGIQSAGNAVYFDKWLTGPNRKLEVLHNWIGEAPLTECSIDLAKTGFAGRKIFVYAGNMGVAQNVAVFLELAIATAAHDDMGFVFVGRGSEFERLRAIASEKNLSNVRFFPEISPDEIPALYKQCDAGLVALDTKHRTHNIPGKFLTYMQAGLPVLAKINPGNDLEQLINSEAVGYCSTSDDVNTLQQQMADLIEDLNAEIDFRSRGQGLASRLFSSSAAVKQIATALDSQSAQH